MPPVPRLSSSTYWIPPNRRLSTMNSTGTSSSTSESRDSGDSRDSRTSRDSRDSAPRNYVDPWDLENYAYLRRHCADADDSDPVVSLSTNGVDSAHSDFYFVPARQPLAQIPQPYRARGPRRPSLMVTAEEAAAALIEEEDFYNARCELRPPPCIHQAQAVRRHSCAPTMSTPAPCTDHLLGLHPGLIERAKVRQMSTTKEPPPLVYVYQTPRQNRKPSRQFREYIQPISTSSEETEDMYDELLSLARRRKLQHQPRHFGLSTFGHLKIDYSCNWTNLDRYIAHA